MHPFRGLINWPGSPSGQVTVDMTPTTWVPPLQPQVQVATLSAPPTDAFDTFSPPAPSSPLITQLPPQPDDASGIVHFEASGLEPGAMLFADLATDVEGIAPTEGTIDDDGRCEDISVVANGGESVCFSVLDAAGNVSPATCVTVTPPVSVPTPALPARLSARDQRRESGSDQRHVRLRAATDRARRARHLRRDGPPGREDHRSRDRGGRAHGEVGPRQKSGRCRSVFRPHFRSREGRAVAASDRVEVEASPKREETSPGSGTRPSGCGSPRPPVSVSVPRLFRGGTPCRAPWWSAPSGATRARARSSTR